ncbi:MULTISPECIES: ABC transporter permease [unclassified Pseudomonas]|uniref:ABC transporter permease n=1 Tax=unclassified Pseudomonas TaxID=196821 RepID=UPI0025CFC88E|nr:MULTISPECIES: ABC transporter permease [unclassified Pseudomonas]
MKKLAWTVAGLLFLALMVWLWQVLADARIISPAFFSSPQRAWTSLVRGLSNGPLFDAFTGTVERMVYGWLVAGLAGIVTGSLIGTSKAARTYLGPTLEMLRPLPAAAIIPLAIAVFGLTNTMVIAVVAFGAFWPTLLSTIHGFSEVEPRLYEVSRALGLSRWQVIFKIALPSAMPDVLAGLRLSITVALGLSVVGEMLASGQGLGQWILVAGRMFRAPDVFAGIILLGGIGVFTAWLLAILENHFLKWRKTY